MQRDNWACFFFGVVFGFFSAYLLLAFLLSAKEEKDNKEDEENVKNISKLGKCDEKGGSDNNNPSKEYKEEPLSTEELEVLDKAIVSLSGDISEVMPHKSECLGGQVATKDLVLKFKKLSAEAKERQRHIKQFRRFVEDLGKAFGMFGKELQKMSKQAEVHVAGQNAFLDKWWNSLAIALDHLSQDQAYVCNAMCGEIKDGMTSVETEHDHLEKNIYLEASKFMNKLRDENDVFTVKKKEFERVRDKAISLHASSTSPTAASSTSPIIQKSAKYEAALKEANEATSRLTLTQKEFDEKMPRILVDYELMASNGQSSLMALLIKMTNILTHIQTKSNQITNRLKLDLASSAAKDSANSQSNYNPVIQELLEDIARQGANRSKMDMTLESSAGLASTLASQLPTLPPQFQHCISTETCVWFNAFSGRLYRDAARSEYFNNWFCVKVAQLLNKGKRSALIDEYHISEAKFGSTPPIIRNMQWIPITQADSSSATSPDAVRDPEYDIDCTAEVAFRSGLSFTVTTRVWINWPVEKYAFIPVILKLECSELCGKIRFGVMKQNSFLSFVGEPFTRFSVKSEVGDQYKLKNIPKISNVVINKIKKHIRTKLVYPKRYKLRLLWPKKWWPEEPSLSSDTVESSQAEAKDETPEQQNRESEPREDEKEDKGEASKERKSTENVDSGGKRSWSNWFALTSTRCDEAKHASDSDMSDSDSNDDLEDIDGEFSDMNHRRTGIDAVDKVHPDHVRLYVSTLLQQSNKIAPRNVHPKRFAQDDILLKKSPSKSSIAIVRTRAHSISEFRHAALDVMWGEFMGSIGHDFSTFTKPPVESDVEAKPKPPPKAAIRHRRRRILASMRDRLLGVHKSASKPDSRGVRCSKAATVLSPEPRVHCVEVTPPPPSSSSSLVLHEQPQSPLSLPEPSTPEVKPEEHLRLSKLETSSEDTDKPSGVVSVPKESEGDVLANQSVMRSIYPTEEASLSADEETSSLEDAIAAVEPGAVLHASSSQDTVPSTSSSETLPKSIASNPKAESKVTRGKVSDGYRNRLSLVVGSLRKASTALTKPSHVTVPHDDDEESRNFQEEAMRLTWQAQTEAITASAMSGEHPSMQNFLRAPQLSADKCWVVLKHGKLKVFPHDPKRDKGVPMDSIVPIKEIDLYGCSCRPMEQPNGFEVGIVKLDTKKNLSQIELSRLEVHRWVPFWTEVEEQCRVWIMAIQFSATMHRYVEK